jgi:hypothetical protein
MLRVCGRYAWPALFSQVTRKTPSTGCPSGLMKKMLFISGVVALVQALLIVVAGVFEVYNSYRYSIMPVSDHNGFGGTVILVAPFILFSVALYFFFFFACSLVTAVFLFQQSYLRICFALTLVL